jgi:hypothetical protein
MSSLFAATDQYTNTMFVRALKQGGFVLIRLNPPTGEGQPQEVCVPEAGLIGAIHVQYHLGYDGPGRERALQIALATKNRTFSFTNSKAFDVVKPLYTPSQLADIQRQLSKFTNSQLVSQLQATQSKVHGLYSDHAPESYRDAVAHVLLDRGILVNEDDRSGRLYSVEAAKLRP